MNYADYIEINPKRDLEDQLSLEHEFCYDVLSWLAEECLQMIFF